MSDLEPHYTYLATEFAVARAAPLSLRKALLVVMLADAYADRLFAADPEADDILVFREMLARRSPALALVFDLALPRDNGPRLVIEPVEIPIADYGKLGVADFMVSLYNRHTVQRVRVAMPDGSRQDVHEVLTEAIAALGSPSPDPLPEGARGHKTRGRSRVATALAVGTPRPSGERVARSAG